MDLPLTDGRCIVDLGAEVLIAWQRPMDPPFTDAAVEMLVRGSKTDCSNSKKKRLDCSKGYPSAS
jgi:hypothetical protein